MDSNYGSDQNIRRRYNTEQENYILPVDQEEIDRLNSQHRAFELLLEGLIPQEIQWYLRAPGGNKRVFDVGCGTGQWLIELVEAYPGVTEAVGIDITLMHPPEYPFNVKFVKKDALKPFPEDWLGKFDLIQARFLITGIKDFSSLLDNLASLLKPNGYLIVVEPEVRAKSTTCSNLEEVCPAIAAFGEMSGDALDKFGINACMAQNISVNMIRSGLFVDIEKRVWELPMSDWSNDPIFREIGEAQLPNSLAYPDTIKRLLLASGMINEREFEIMKRDYQREIREGRGQVVLPIWMVWGRKT